MRPASSPSLAQSAYAPFSHYIAEIATLTSWRKQLLSTTFPAGVSRTVAVSYIGTDNVVHAITASPSSTGASVVLGATTAYYAFTAPVSAAGVSSFVVQITQGGRTVVYDNAGARFPVVDGVQWLPLLSSASVDATHGVLSVKFSAAVSCSPYLYPLAEVLLMMDAGPHVAESQIRLRGVQHPDTTDRDNDAEDRRADRAAHEGLGARRVRVHVILVCAERERPRRDQCNLARGDARGQVDDFRRRRRSC